MTKKCFCSREQLWNIINEWPHPVLITSHDGLIAGANKQAHIMKLDTIEIGDYLSQCIKNQEIHLDNRIYRCSYKHLGNDYIVWYLTDITDYKMIQKNNKELEEVFQSSNDEIFVTDGKGIVTKINKAGENHYGVSSKDMVGKKAEELSLAGFFSNPLTPEIIKSREKMSIIQVTNDGRTLYVTGNPVFNKKGELIQIIYNCRDLTELKSLEQRLSDTESLLSIYRLELMKSGEILNFMPVHSHSYIVRKLIEAISRVALSNSMVLILGEKGVGKSVVARLIHEWSICRDKPFIRVKCNNIPEKIFERELFGYKEKLNGPKDFKKEERGLVELAEGGTLYIDEIVCVPIELQKKLLRLIKTKEFNRVGERIPRKVDVRIIVSSSRDLRMLLDSGKLDEELFYYINVMPINVPPLRKRVEEIPYFIDYFLNKFNKKYGLEKVISASARERILAYHWPGNIDELKDLVERLVLTSSQHCIEESEIPKYIKPYEKPQTAISVHRIIPLKQAVELVEKELLWKTYREYGSTYKMATILDVNQSTIVRKLNKIKLKMI